VKIALNISYFIATICVGAFTFTIGLTPLVTTLPEEAVRVGLFNESGSARVALYFLIAGIWAAILIWVWVRNGSLVPSIIKPGSRVKYVLGNSLILLGHLMVLSVYFVKAMQWLMILPVLIVLVCYFSGVVLVELSRQRVMTGGEEGRR
jgi:hypothetical protein